VCSFRAYLNIPIPAHRKAVVQLLTSSHALVVEVLRWSERRQSPVPRNQHLCCHCQSDVEDEVHALSRWYCDTSQKVHDLRRDFFHIFALAPSTFLSSLQSAPSTLHVMRLFSDAEDAKILCRFAKFVFDIFCVF
ncbi:hypothetical protein IW262DRAFT_1236725, partial [Armillaria fumosa]